MNFFDLLMLSTRAFKTKPVRTFLTILGMSVGIGTVLFLVSLGYGLQRAVLNKITTADALLSLDVSPGTSELIKLNEDSIKKISQNEKVVEISPATNISAQFSINNLTGDGLIYAVDPSYFRLSGLSPQFGEIFSSPETLEVVISSAGARLFNFEENKIIGEKVELTLFLPKEDENGSSEYEIVKKENKYKVVGVIKDDDANYLYAPRGSLGDIGQNNYAQLKVRVLGNEHMEEVREEIINMGFLVSSLSDTIDQANKIFKIIQVVLALFGLVALMVSAIGMFNTMTIALLERINEIGIMRAIGASRQDIKKLFLFESLVIGFLGGVGGVIIGYATGEIANFFINILARNFGGQAMDLFFRPPWFILVIIFSSALVGLITGVYPSKNAAKINPLDALRYK